MALFIGLFSYGLNRPSYGLNRRSFDSDEDSEAALRIGSQN